MLYWRRWIPVCTAMDSSTPTTVRIHSLERFRLKIYLPENLEEMLGGFSTTRLVHSIIAEWISRLWKVTQTPGMCCLSGNVRANMCKHFHQCVHWFIQNCSTKFVMIKGSLCNNSWCNRSIYGSCIALPLLFKEVLIVRTPRM